MRYATRPLGGLAKQLDIDRFCGVDVTKLVPGQLTDVSNMHVLSGGALHTLLAERQIGIAPPASLAGIYTYYDDCDARYETPTTPEWVYANVCPADVLQYSKYTTAASRLFIADVGMAGKGADGYRNVLGAFSDGEETYILYDAVYAVIDQRRTDEYSKVGSGYVVQFDGRENETYGTYTAACILTQLWLDKIDRDGDVTATLVTAYLAEKTRYADTLCRATLLSEDGETYRYASADYIPVLGSTYTARPDAIYEQIYPTLAESYKAESAFAGGTRRIVRYSNRIAGEGDYGAVGEKLLILPDMRLLVRSDGTWSLAEKSDSIPDMDAAVQHFERLYGIAGDRLYVSAAGNCADYTEGEENLPVTAAWQTVTAERGGFTAIASFDGQVVVFTEGSMMTVRGTELPFSLSYVGAYGCRAQEALAALGGWLYFASACGILRYNGSRVEDIGMPLPREYSFADAMLTVADGMLAVSFLAFDGLYFYDPQSESWSRRASLIAEGFPGGGLVLAKTDGGAALYRIFGAEGAFSAAVSLGCGARRRLISVSLTVCLAPQAVLELVDGAGNVLLSVDLLFGETVTRTAYLRGMYTDCDSLLLRGSGDVTVYGISVQYAPTGDRQKQIR